MHVQTTKIDPEVENIGLEANDPTTTLQITYSKIKIISMISLQYRLMNNHV